MKKEESEVSLLSGKLEKRAKELKLINIRVRVTYFEEIKNNGLVIIEAYYGPYALIQELKTKNPNQRLKLLMDESVEGKLIDVTDALRYYVDDSRLILQQRSKKSLLGFFELELSKDEVPILFIKYTYRDLEYSKEFKDYQGVQLP